MKSPEFPQACNTRTNPTTNNSAATTASGQDNLGEERTTQETQDTITTLENQIEKLTMETVFLMNCVDELEMKFQDELKRMRGVRVLQQVVN